MSVLFRLLNVVHPVPDTDWTGDAKRTFNYACLSGTPVLNCEGVAHGWEQTGYSRHEGGDLMWFNSWAEILRVVLVGAASYAALVLLLRVSGKRTLGQLNAFDFIVTVALGSTLATILLSSDVPFIEGLAALGLLLALQFIVAWASSHVSGARAVLTARPVALVVSGELQHDQLRKNRLSESEVLQAIRATGSGDLSHIAAVVLETNGSLSVITKNSRGDGSALEGVQGLPRSGDS